MQGSYMISLVPFKDRTRKYVMICMISYMILVWNQGSGDTGHGICFRLLHILFWRSKDHVKGHWPFHCISQTLLHLDRHNISTAILALYMLSRSHTLELSVHHYSQSGAQCLTLFHWVGGEDYWPPLDHCVMDTLPEKSKLTTKFQIFILQNLKFWKQNFHVVRYCKIMKIFVTRVQCIILGEKLPEKLSINLPTQAEVPHQKQVCPAGPKQSYVQTFADKKHLCRRLCAFKTFRAVFACSKVSMSRLSCVHQTFVH